MNSLAELNEFWQPVYNSMSEAIVPSALKIWFGNARLIYMNDTIALLNVENNYKRDIIRGRFTDVLKEHFYRCLGFEIDVDVVAEPKVSTEEEAEAVYRAYLVERAEEEKKEKEEELAETIRVIKPDPPEPEDNSPQQKKSDKKRALSYYTFDNFIKGESNKFACAACYAIANGGEADYNPLLIYGKSGLGKTHLMYATVNRLFQRNKNLNVIYIRGEEFANQLIEAIKNGNTEEFREKYRNADVLLMDDIQFIAGKSSTQDEFFNTFEALYKADKQIIVTCDRPIYDINRLEERVRNRLEWGLIADITAPDNELRQAIIRKKAEEVNLTLPQDVIEYASKRLIGNVRMIEGFVKKMSALHFLSGKKINMDLAKEAVAGFVKEKDPKSDKIEKIMMTVCDRYNISKETILGKKRKAEIVLARHVSMYLLYSIDSIKMTFEEIATLFSCDHSSVMSARDKIERKISESPEFAADILAMKKEIGE
ncbi:MAG: chromosomal replication initiator protein DnaA [Clostridia bacterium]|nr:chromosomal replication initiator protein DnaA [Clostridia bacterium]